MIGWDQDEAVRLRADGWSYRAIGERFGVGLKVARRRLDARVREAERVENLARKAQKLEWARSHAGRKRCPECGGPMGVGTAGREYARCMACHRRRMRAHRLVRLGVVERMWRDGASRREIAVVLNTTTDVLGALMTRARREGLVDLPYRYNLTRRKAAA